jgi:hypothetical protein
MKTRKDLPSFGYLRDIKVDINALLNHCIQQELLDPGKYNSIQVKNKTGYEDFIKMNHHHCHDYIMSANEDCENMESYKQLALTEFDESKRTGNVFESTPTTVLHRSKRIDPSRASYVPEADEHNYGVRNSLVTGEIEKLLDMFTSSVKRVRFAYMKEHHKFGAHRDYDPSYLTRYHIPLITNPGVIFFAKDNHGIERSLHLPADGRIYFLNAGHLHWVHNNSDQGRVHLIVDVHGQKELENLEELNF